MSSTVLEISKVRKSFDTELVLEDISIKVPEHTATVFIGASGSGKSTLLRCINLLEPIDDGVIKLDGNDITDVEINADEVRRKIGMVFQAFNLFPHMSVLENIILAPIRVQNIDRAQAISQAEELLRRFGLLDKANQYPDRLSGGQQQRVAIIRSLALNPRLLLLDAITFVALHQFSIGDSICAIVGGAVVILTRVVSIQFDLHLPKFSK